jgi:hypothetical protein
MRDSDESATADSGRQSKIARLIEEYDLQGLGAKLEQMWTAEEDRRSLRDLAADFNQRLLEQRLEASSVQQLDGELENTYRLLTDGEVSSAETTRIERRLERNGVDVESLRNDFVTYQAIRSYLKECRGAEYSPAETDPLEREAATVQKLQGRMVSVTEGKLERLREGGHLSLGEFRTLGKIQVVCEDCNTQLDVRELLDRGGCYCDDK